MQPFQNLLVHVSGFDAPWRRALALAKAGTVRVTLLSVIEPPDRRITNLGPENKARALERRRGEYMADLTRVSEVFLAADVDVRTRLVEGDPARELAAQVGRGAHDLLLKAVDCGTNQDLSFRGTVDEHLLRHVDACPVWMLRPRATTHDAVLVALDAITGDEQRADLNRRLLHLARDTAAALDGELHVVHVSESSSTATALDGLLAGAGVIVPPERVHKEHGDARRVLPALAARLGVDSIVLGTLARSGDERLHVGRTAETVLREAPCSVLALRPAPMAVLQTA